MTTGYYILSRIILMVATLQIFGCSISSPVARPPDKSQDAMSLASPGPSKRPHYDGKVELPPHTKEEFVSPDGRISLAFTTEQEDSNPPKYFFVDRKTGKAIGSPDIPQSGCKDLIWNPSGTGIAFVRRYGTHYYGARIYTRNSEGDFMEVELNPPHPLEIYKSLPEHPVSFVLPMTDAAARFWIDDHTVSLIEIAQEVGAGGDGEPLSEQTLFASYLATVHDHKAVVSQVQLHGPATFNDLARKFALSDR